MMISRCRAYISAVLTAALFCAGLGIGTMHPAAAESAAAPCHAALSKEAGESNGTRSRSVSGSEICGAIPMTALRARLRSAARSFLISANTGCEANGVNVEST